MEFKVNLCSFKRKVVPLKVTLNIKDEEAAKVLALLKDLPYVEIEE
jgi:cell division protein FtsI/penicillin-binding protein 2